jgi:hypothetical protein
LAWWQQGTEGDAVIKLNLIIIALCICWLFVAFLNYKQYLTSLVAMIGAKSDFKKSKVPDTSIADSSSSVLPHLIKPENYSLLETFISQITTTEDRFNAAKEYFGKINPRDFNRKNKGFAKNEFTKLLFACEQDLLTFNHIGPNDEFKPLKSALLELIEQKVEVLNNILSGFDSAINFYKIVDCIKANDANVRSEAIEVLKGVLGPRKTDIYVNLILPNSSARDNDFHELKAILSGIMKYSQPLIIKSTLQIFSNETFLEGKTFITSCFKHPDDTVRESALKMYLSLENDPGEIKKYCEDLSGDSSSIITSIVESKIQKS